VEAETVLVIFRIVAGTALDAENVLLDPKDTRGLIQLAKRGMRKTHEKVEIVLRIMHGESAAFRRRQNQGQPSIEGNS
jgi:hypothetical protein